MRQARLSGQLNRVALKPLPNCFLNVGSSCKWGDIFLYLQTKKGEQWKGRNTSVLPSTSAIFSRVLMTDEKFVFSVGKFLLQHLWVFASDNIGRESQWIGPFEEVEPNEGV